MARCHAHVASMPSRQAGMRQGALGLLLGHSAHVAMQPLAVQQLVHSRAGLVAVGNQLDEDEDEAQRERCLPQHCWLQMLEQLPVREVCMLARVNRWLRQLALQASVWQQCHWHIWGEAPDTKLDSATVRRLCRRSELKAARWRDAWPQVSMTGPLGTSCLQMDDSKVVSADGCMIRLWSHATGRRLATLKGHAGRVTCLAFDEQLLVSGCSQAGLKVWSMDELKCSRSLRGHEGAITGVGILGHGMVVSGGEDGHIKVWDAASAGAVLDLDCGQPCGALQVHPASGQLVCSGYGVQLWDLSAAQLLHTLELGPDSGPLASQPGASPPGPDIHPGLHLQPNHPTHDLAPGVASAEAPPWPAPWAVPEAAAPGSASGLALPTAAAAGVVDMGSGVEGGGTGTSSLTSVTYNGSLVAAGGGGCVAVWDTRCLELVGRLDLNSVVQGMQGQGGSQGCGQGAEQGWGASSKHAAGRAADGLLGSAGSRGQGPVQGSRCVGLQLDDWKLVVGCNPGRCSGSPAGPARGGLAGVVTVHDMRAAHTRNGRWRQPVMQLQAPARVNCFQFFEQELLAGLDGQECCLWSMQAPTLRHAHSSTRAYGGLSTPDLSSGPDAALAGPRGSSLGEHSHSFTRYGSHPKVGRQQQRGAGGGDFGMEGSSPLQDGMASCSPMLGGMGILDESPGGKGAGKGAARKKAGKVPKQKGKFPKRTTR
ncbi:WD40-repeat-containing domain protein [Haematococcus lacustris]